MPKILTPAMRAHLDEETTRLAAIWRITRKDGAQFFFTDHDRDIVFGGDTYRADAGFERTAIRSDAGFAVDNLDLVGVFAEGGIVEDEVRAGLFDGAEIALSFVNWQDPDGHGEIRLRRGTLGEVRLTPQGHFTAELRGLSQPLAHQGLRSGEDRGLIELDTLVHLPWCDLDPRCLHARALIRTVVAVQDGDLPRLERHLTAKDLRCPFAQRRCLVRARAQRILGFPCAGGDAAAGLAVHQ